MPLGITAHSILQPTSAEGEPHLGPVHVRQARPGSAWFAQSYERFAPVRKEAGRSSEQENEGAAAAEAMADEASGQRAPR
jgi:hypothetical protein